MNRSIQWVIATAAIVMGAALLVRPPGFQAPAGTAEADNPAGIGKSAARADSDRPASDETARATSSQVESPARPQLRRVEFVNADGTVTVAWTPEVGGLSPERPYDRYDNDSLAILAYGDAEAAEVLGLRLRRQDEAESLKYMLRAAALSGRPDALQAYVNSGTNPVEVDGHPVARTLRERYVLSLVENAVSANPAELAQWEARIRAELPDPDREIEHLRREAETLMRRMRDVQREVTGSARIGGLDDV